MDMPKKGTLVCPSFLKLLAPGEEKGLLDLPVHSKAAGRRKEMYPEALINTKRNCNLSLRTHSATAVFRRGHRIGQIKYRRGWKRGFE